MGRRRRAGRGRTARRGAFVSRLDCTCSLNSEALDCKAASPTSLRSTESQQPSWTRQQRLAIPASMSTSTLGWG